MLGSRISSRSSSPVAALMMRMCRSLDEQQDVGPGVGPAGADVVEAAAVAQGDGAVGVEPVGADPVVGVGVAGAGGSFGPGLVGGGRGGPVRQGPVRPLVVVDGGEGAEKGLEFGKGGGLGVLGGQPVLQRLLEPLGFALGLGVVRAAVFLPDPQAA